MAGGVVGSEQFEDLVTCLLLEEGVELDKVHVVFDEL